MTVLALAALLAAPAFAAEPPATVKVKVSWDYEGVPSGMTIRAQKAGDFELWDTGTAATAAATPAGDEFPAQVAKLKPGEALRAVLVYHNKSAKTVRFFAAPHAATPSSATLGFKFKCLCTNHVYEVPPGRFWYRVVELRLAREYEGRRLEIRHNLVAVTGPRAEAFMAEGGN